MGWNSLVRPFQTGHAGVLRQLFHDLLAVAAVLDAVKHPAQHPGGVGDGLLLADLAAGGVQVGDFHAQIVAATSKLQRVRVEVFSKMSPQTFLPSQLVGRDTGLLLWLSAGRPRVSSSSCPICGRPKCNSFMRLLSSSVNVPFPHSARDIE